PLTVAPATRHRSRVVLTWTDVAGTGPPVVESGSRIAANRAGEREICLLPALAPDCPGDRAALYGARSPAQPDCRPGRGRARKVDPRRRIGTPTGNPPCYRHKKPSETDKFCRPLN